MINLYEPENLPALWKWFSKRLEGQQISLETKIFQEVETWDLICIDLPYRKAFIERDVLEYIQSQVGKRFDPRAVEKFIVMIKAQ